MFLKTRRGLLPAVIQEAIEGVSLKMMCDSGRTHVKSRWTPYLSSIDEQIRPWQEYPYLDLYDWNPANFILELSTPENGRLWYIDPKLTCCIGKNANQILFVSVRRLFVKNQRPEVTDETGILLSQADDRLSYLKTLQNDREAVSAGVKDLSDVIDQLVARPEKEAIYCIAEILADAATGARQLKYSELESLKEKCARGLRAFGARATHTIKRGLRQPDQDIREAFRKASHASEDIGST